MALLHGSAQVQPARPGLSGIITGAAIINPRRADQHPPAALTADERCGRGRRCPAAKMGQLPHAPHSRTWPCSETASGYAVWRAERMESGMAGKAVISLSTGLEDAEKVTVAFLVAVGAAEQGRPTLMFCTKEAVRLTLDG